MSITNLPTYEELELIPVREDLPKDPEVKNTDPVVETLKRMRKRLEKNWTTGSMQKGDNYCLVGAVQKETIGIVRELYEDEVPDNYSMFRENLWLCKALLIASITYTFTVLTDKTYRQTIRALKRQARFFHVVQLVMYNDHNDQKDVLHLIDRTIESRERKLRKN